MRKSEILKDVAIAALGASLVVTANKSGSKGLIVVGVTGLATITTIDIIRLISLRKTNKKIEEFLQNNKEA